MKNLLPFLIVIFAVLGCKDAPNNKNAPTPTFSPTSQNSRALFEKPSEPAVIQTATPKVSPTAAATAKPEKFAEKSLSNPAAVDTDLPDTDKSTVKRQKRTAAIEDEINNSGASAKCRDGSLSYSAHRRGTCSHHGGVAVWY